MLDVDHSFSLPHRISSIGVRVGVSSQGTPEGTFSSMGSLHTFPKLCGWHEDYLPSFRTLVTSFLASIVAWFERTVSSLCCISVHAPTQNLMHHMGRARLNLAVCMMLALLTPVQADTAAAQKWHHDLGSGCSHTYQVRKRALLRAIARAKKHPERGTWYRNR